MIPLLLLAAAVALTWLAASGAPYAVSAGPLPLPVAAAVLAFAINFAAFVPAAAWRTERFYDLLGSLTYLAVVGLVLATAPLGPAGLAVAACVTLWALRLGSFLVWRVHAAGRDRRFDQLKHHPGRFAVAWALQALWVTLTLLAALIQWTWPRAVDPWLPVGLALWAAGFTLEVVADAQKARFRADPAHRGRWIDVGLWAWCRHPNYLGEIILWTGVFLCGVGGYRGWGWLAAASPLFVFALLRFGSGVPLLEAAARERWGQDAAWQAYMARTPRLVPRPPRR